MSTPRVRIEALADDALLLRFGDAIDDAVNARVHVAAALLRECGQDWIVDIVPAYVSLAVFFDIDAFANEPGAASPLANVETKLRALLATTGPMQDMKQRSRTVQIPVVYGGDAGPDLLDAANELGMSADDLARRHADGAYHVAMIGFAPGFPYLSGLDPLLALPRLDSPRTRVPAGSVGIGGTQTGVYPRAGAGGWRLIGRTPRVLFDATRDPPSLLAPGDRVRFVAVDTADFAEIEHGGQT